MGSERTLGSICKMQWKASFTKLEDLNPHGSQLSLQRLLYFHAAVASPSHRRIETYQCFGKHKCVRGRCLDHSRETLYAQPRPAFRQTQIVLKTLFHFFVRLCTPLRAIVSPRIQSWRGASRIPPKRPRTKKGSLKRRPS